jgi:hypothetical protein
VLEDDMEPAQVSISQFRPAALERASWGVEGVRNVWPQKPPARQLRPGQVLPRQLRPASAALALRSLRVSTERLRVPGVATFEDDSV